MLVEHLEGLGGEIDGEGMGIADAPQFNVGDREIVFIENNGSQLIPLVGMMYGRFHIRPSDLGQDVITTNDDEPVKAEVTSGRGAIETRNRCASTAPDAILKDRSSPADTLILRARRMISIASRVRLRLLLCFRSCIGRTDDNGFDGRLPRRTRRVGCRSRTRIVATPC